MGCILVVFWLPCGSLLAPFREKKNRKKCFYEIVQETHMSVFLFWKIIYSFFVFSYVHAELQNEGAAVLAPLGAFGSAAPVAQQRGLRRVRHICRLLQTPKPQTDPALCADRTDSDHNLSLLPTLRPQRSDFWHTFCRSKIHQKSDSSKIPPKSQKSDT